ncbi:MAG: HD domain-containing protein [Patescibacteria group bacterium]|jgi:HD superfamily phosphohydrolase
MQYLDPLYGHLEITDKQYKLFQTKALTRVRDISLSAVPPLATPIGMIGSRFEHSVGVAHLSSLLTAQDQFKEMSTNLYLASLFHDVGSPPFSHITEKFLEEVTGKNHEEFANTFLLSEETTQAIKDFGGDTEIVLQLITGNQKPWSDLINGTIDLDNLDNSLRWGSAIGLFHTKFYEPEELIKAFVMQDKSLALRLEFHPQIQKWELCRRLVYDVVYSDLNLTPETMLFRALQFAYEHGDLDETFFTLTDSQALYVLEHRANPMTQKLMSWMRHWQFYVSVFEMEETGTVSETFKTFCLSWRERQKIADIVADSLGISKEYITVYAGKDRGFKKIHLPFIGKGVAEEHQPLQKLYWRIKVYIHPQYHDLKNEVEDVVNSIINENI